MDIINITKEDIGIEVVDWHEKCYKVTFTYKGAKVRPTLWKSNLKLDWNYGFWALENTLEDVRVKSLVEQMAIEAISKGEFTTRKQKAKA